MTSATESAPFRDALILAAMFVVVWIFWHTWLVFPLKILVVLFHELSHGAAAVVTGGSIERIELAVQEGGLCVTRGGSPFWVLSAGYLGSLFWGGLILLGAARTDLDRQLQVALGLVLLGAAALWVRPVLSFGFGFAAVMGLLLTAAGRLLPTPAVDLLLKLIGLTSVLYAVVDIADDVLARPGLAESDAGQLAELTGIPTLAWGAFWMLLALASAFWFLRSALGRRSGGDQPTPGRISRR